MGKIKLEHSHVGRQVRSLLCYGDVIMLCHNSAYARTSGIKFLGDIKKNGI